MPVRCNEDLSIYNGMPDAGQPLRQPRDHLSVKELMREDGVCSFKRIFL